MQPVYLTYTALSKARPRPIALNLLSPSSSIAIARLSPVTHPLGHVGGVRDALIAPESDYT